MRRKRAVGFLAASACALTMAACSGMPGSSPSEKADSAASAASADDTFLFDIALSA